MSLPTSEELYKGAERRAEHRREVVDRREMIRFELDKSPRRSGKDRRGPKSIWDGREQF